ncbi:hypothetical protein GCM10009639_31790 [Kitasatospora putterlickiae]|uniref:Exo-alpha-sialidase n=1 Tax=Kitasatospora putterlickiae TaxID=221725 RepID=A0ABP4IPZ4_9ACTN
MLTAAFVATTAAATTVPRAPEPAPPVALAALCGTDAAAQGLASGAVPGTLVEAGRADGRTEQFQQFYDDTATNRQLPFVWHRSQDAPGGAYGAWERVSATPVGPKLYQVSAIENGAGGLEVFIASYGGFCHTVSATPGGAWTPAEVFGLTPPPYHGGLALFRDAAANLHAFAASSNPYGTIQFRSQYGGTGGTWGPVGTLPVLPEPNVGLSTPTVTQMSTGSLRLVAHEWNADTRYWQTSELAPNRGWRPWQPCADSTCS